MNKTISEALGLVRDAILSGWSPTVRLAALMVVATICAALLYLVQH